MKHERAQSRKEELYALILFFLLELLIIPLKPWFYQTALFSLHRFVIYQFTTIAAALILYFYIKHSALRVSLQKIEISPPTEPLSAPLSHIQSDTLQKTEGTTIIPEVKEEPSDTLLLRNAQETILSLQDQLKKNEHEKQTLEKRLEEHGKDLSHAHKKLESFFLLTRQLTADLKKQNTLIEEERKKHALEMRILVMKEAKPTEKGMLPSSIKNSGDKSCEKLSITTPFVQGISTETIIASLLTSCKEATFTNHPISSKNQNIVACDWPSLSYPLLVKRKIYETIGRTVGTSIGAVSIKDPALEITLSPTLQPIKNKLIQVILENKEKLALLDEFEPLYISITEKQFIFFRCVELGIEDIVLFGVSSSYPK